MRAKFVYEAVNFQRGKSPKSSMDLGIGTKKAMTKAIEKFYEASGEWSSYMEVSPFYTRNGGARMAFIVESDKSDIGSKLNEIAKYSGLEIYFDKVFQLNNLGGTPYMRKAMTTYQYVWYLKPEFENGFETALNDYLEI